MYNYTVKLFKEAFQYNITILNRSKIFYNLEKEPTWKFEVILKGVMEEQTMCFQWKSYKFIKRIGIKHSKNVVFMYFFFIAIIGSTVLY